MTRLLLAALAAALLGCVILGGVLWWQRGELDDMRTELDLMTLANSACQARQENIRKDKESDAQVDNMPDLRAVPPGWLMPPPGTGGLY